MTDADPARPQPAAKHGGSELMLRVLSALVLAPLTVGVAYLGGWAFVAFWGVAALLVLWEWTSIVTESERRTILMTGGGSVALAVMLAGAFANLSDGHHAVRLLTALIVLVAGMIAAAALAPKERRAWIVAGIPYAGLLGIAPIVLRFDVQYGFIAIVFLFAVVWTTDIAAYFAGRAIGGPKLAPKISPKKTWSGAIGGVIGGIVAAIVVARTAGLADVLALGLLAVALSIAAQCGDLFESALKRRFGTKDSGHLIPGHGGLMDRLDGFMVATVLATLIGIAHGEITAPARGLLLW